MKLLIHDLEDKDFQKLFPSPLNETLVISNDGSIHPCIGCFGCWIKTPGACVIRDNYGDNGENMSKCNKLIIISKCCYGGFSPFVKNVLDRSISYVHPYFEIRNGEMHHKRRYTNCFDMEIWFYGDNITDSEKSTAQRLVKANSTNFDSNIDKIEFIHDIQELEGQLV